MSACYEFYDVMMHQRMAVLFILETVLVLFRSHYEHVCMYSELNSARLQSIINTTWNKIQQSSFEFSKTWMFWDERVCFSADHHRLNGSSSPVLTATSLSYGKAKNSTPPHRIKTPDLIEIKFGTVDYVGKMTPHAKFHVNPFNGGFPANGWNIRKNFL